MNPSVKLISSKKDYLDTFYVYVDSLNEFDSFKCMNGKFFSCILLNFSPTLDSIEFTNFANRMLKSGLVVFQSWGNDCERLHDLFDEEYCTNFERPEDTEKNVILTIWHENESLKEGIATSYWMCPASDYLDGYKTNLFINLQGKSKENEILNYLFNLELLNENEQ